MTVQELIDALSNLDPDSYVEFADGRILETVEPLADRDDTVVLK